MNEIMSLIASVLVVLLALPVHEFAHAFAAVKAGDPTPKLEGRYTINPIKHFDLLGLFMLILVRFGWAKPVPINPYNFRHLKRDYFWVSIAGILSNLAMAIVFSFLLMLFSLICAQNLNYSIHLTAEQFCYNAEYLLKLSFSNGHMHAIVYSLLLLLYFVFLYGIIININLCVFNLIPVFPLDGFRILDCLLKRKGRAFQFLRTKGYYVLLGLILWGFLCDRIAPYMEIFKYLDVFGLTLSTVNNTFLNLIIKFWGLFF